MRELLLVGSIASAAVYGIFLCDRTPTTIRTIVKSGSIGLLALWAVVERGPSSLIVALVLSAIGDAFLAGNPKRWLLPGMAAFLSAHVSYLALFLSLETRPTGVPTWAAQIGLLVMAVTWSFYLWRDAGPLKWPVGVYAITIALMGAAALRLPTDRWMAMLGAGMFIASDIILSLELFKTPEHARSRAVTSRILWALYYFGQTLIAAGVVGK